MNYNHYIYLPHTYYLQRKNIVSVLKKEFNYNLIQIKFIITYISLKENFLFPYILPCSL